MHAVVVIVAVVAIIVENLAEPVWARVEGRGDEVSTVCDQKPERKREATRRISVCDRRTIIAAFSHLANDAKYTILQTEVVRLLHWEAETFRFSTFPVSTKRQEARPVTH